MTMPAVAIDAQLAVVSAGFDEVYAAELEAVTRLAYLVVRDRFVAEELAQEAFLRLYHRFADVRNPPGFLRTVVVRLGATWLARRRMETERLALVPPVDAANARGDAYEVDETWAALGRLKPERAVVLVLRFYEDLSYASIAELVGASAATVRSRTRRALKDLRKELAS